MPLSIEPDNTVLNHVVPNNMVPFAELGMVVGSLLTIETISPIKKHGVRLLGYAEGRSILISAPLREGKEVLLDVNSVLTVRALVGKQVCAFESRILYRSIHPYTYYHLAYPQQVETLQIRDSERVETLLETVVDSDFNIVGGWPKKAHINNLSRTGARLIGNEFLGDFGHELLIQLDLNVSGMKKRIGLASIVRNIEREQTDEQLIHYVTGVQFLEMSDEARMTLANYIYEQERPV